MHCIADTSAVIRLVRRDSRTMAVMGDRRFAITFVTVAELYLGTLKTTNPDDARKRLQRVLPEEEVFYSSSATPEIYAAICHDLERRGVRIPTNDIWIAALAIENALPLLGRDEHFRRVDGLTFIPC